MKEHTFTDKRGREWEVFADQSYYGLICVRCLSVPREFNSPLSFHFETMSDASQFAKLVEGAR